MDMYMLTELLLLTKDWKIKYLFELTNNTM